MFKPLECWFCGADMYYTHDEEAENMGSYRFDCTKCGESVLCPKEAPFLQIATRKEGEPWRGIIMIR